MSEINVKSFKVVDATHYRMVKDGTNHDLLVMKFKGGIVAGNLGGMGDGLIVISGNSNQAYLFSEETPSVYDGLYVEDKLFEPRHTSRTDRKNIQMMLEAIITPSHFDFNDGTVKFVGEQPKAKTDQPPTKHSHF